MAENDLVLVGGSRAVILLKAPSSIPAEHRRLLSRLEVVAPHRDGFVLALCRHEQIPTLRQAGAEVIVVDPDVNRYIARQRRSTDEELTAFIDERVKQHREEIAVAERARDREGEDSGGDGTV